MHLHVGQLFMQVKGRVNPIGDVEAMSHKKRAVDLMGRSHPGLISGCLLGV